MHFFHLRLMVSDQQKFQKNSVFLMSKKGSWLCAVIPKKFNRIFHHFPITRSFVLVRCRQFSVLGLTRGSLGSLRPSGHRRTECENWILGRPDKLVSLKPKLVCERVQQFAQSSLRGKLGGLCECRATFRYTVPLPNIFLTRLFWKTRLKRKDFQEDSPAGLGAGGSSSKVL